MSDSEYLPSDDNLCDDTTNDAMSTEEEPEPEPEPSILDTLTESDMADINQHIMLLIDELVTTNILTLSSPKFYDTIIDDATEIVVEEWQDAGLLDDCDYEIDDIVDELHNLVEQIADIYMTSIGPRRSIKYATSSVVSQENPTIPQTLVRKIKTLQNLPQPKQKTREWYEFRYSLISASNLWKVFGTDSQRSSLVAEKCVPFESFQNRSQFMNTESAMHWGNKYEPVTVTIYEMMFGTQIAEFGCIRHTKYPFIGASPDGINIDPRNPALYGRMLEIKNIVNREITGIPKEDYWIQTQIQMETCGLEECDFMETRFKEYTNDEQFYEDGEKEYKGVILHFIERELTRESMPIYRYMPSNLINSSSKQDIDDWIISERESARQEGLVLFNKVFWYLEEFSCVLIERNREWFKSAVPKIEEIWRQVEEQRKGQNNDNKCVNVIKIQ
jgi:putative phage-type endonuclease